MKSQKGFIQVLLILGIVAALAVAGFVLYTQKKNILTAVPAQTTVAPIQNANDLNSAAASLDSTDTTQLDTQLNQLNSSASTF